MVTQIIIIFVLLVVAGLAFIIDWTELVARLFQDKPHCAKMFIDNGKGYAFEDGWLVHEGSEGQVYRYKFKGKVKEVKVGHNYPYRYFKRGRMIGVNPNSDIAIPLWEGDLKEPQFSESDLSALTLGYVLVELVKSIQGKFVIGLKMVLLFVVIIAVVGGAIWWFNSQNNQSKPVPAQITPKPEIPFNSGTEPNLVNPTPARTATPTLKPKTPIPDSAKTKSTPVPKIPTPGGK